ncbi:rho guanine nucleotide exchange factor 12 isoform X3 [Anabrus simplex]|uniref:rho guanine nucleotide exchange factor 12 isoform X3 n=1 Tax=Anabrus simplex TaxID=316456 RepID=UPI0035A347DE
MDNSISGVPERPTGAPTLSNGPSFRRGPHSRSLLVGDPSHIPCVTVIVNKDENGYGMKVSGDNPVYVQSVKEGGAAEKAGLHHGDKIIKVNGVDVMQSTHTDVVARIRSATQVVLTVQQRPRPASTAMAPPGTHTRQVHHHHHSAPARTTERITSPLPVDNAKQRQLECQRVHTLRLMLEKEQRYVESLRSQMAKSNDTKLLQELSGAERRVRTLEEEVLNLTSGVNEFVIPASSPPPLPSRNRPMSSPSQSPPPLPPRQYQHLLPCSEGVELTGSQLSTTNHCVPAPQQVPGHHTHHRTKSSPDPLSMQNLTPAEASKRMLASESMSDLSFGSKRSKGSSGVGFDVDSPRVTPPGTPPPPYGGSSAPSDSIETLQLGDEVSTNPVEENSTPQTARIETVSPEVSPLHNNCTPQYASTTVVQHTIMSMDDDDMSDQEMFQAQLDDHGPFKNLSKLWEHTAHLAVFMNYLISNSDSSSLLFYLVTDLYKEGSAKEMRKWAYEIHSSFLVPGAPLRLNNVDENVAREIDDVLLNESDKEEILRKIFWKARVRAKEELNEQLADFQQKRTAGLGTLFGPPDAQLDESIHDKNKEMKIVESVLLPIIEPYKEDIERDNADIRRFTTAAALATVMSKVFGLRGPHSNALLDRCPTFVSKDKYLKSRLMGKSRKVTVRGHHFVAHQYYTVTYCNHCQLIIWGIGPQGYQCSDCSLNIHRHCVRVVEENCPGPLVKKERGNDRISKLMEKIRPERETRRKPSSHNFVQIEKVKRQAEEEGTLTDGETGTGDRPVGGSRVGERRPDPVRESEERPPTDSPRNDDDDHHEITHHAPKKPSVTSINRSESYKERIHQKRQLRERRKTSDPNLSTKNDVDLDNSQGLSYNTNSGSSSNSSLSTRSLDSPSNSLETVNAAALRTNEAVTVTLTPSSTCFDSDLEAEPDPPDWMQGVDEEVLKTLSPREKKRQEVINELFHTERSHVRNLKVLDQVFYRPMVDSQVLPPDHIQLLFSNLDEMLDIHSQFNNGMKNKRRESPLVGDVADLLLSMFDGPASEEFQRAAATFCARQQIALELLKERRRKDNKLNSFLTDAEGNPMCRRLQLKDIIPTAMQRLTKYPLLFESLAKYTSSSSEEVNGVQRAVERSKEILNHVNHAVREAEDNQRLNDIQKKLDKSGFERVDHPMAGEFKNLDLTKHRLIYEGALTWRIGNRQKLIDLHVLLLDDVIILLQKQDDKYCLKFYNTNAGDRSPTLSPVIKVSTVLVRPNAVDKKALYLVNTSQNGAQIYDLVATTSSERKIWFRHISEAAEAYKTRDGKNRRPEPPASSLPLSTPDSETPETLQDKTKDSEETGGDSAKESSSAPDLLVPPGSSTQDAESSPSEGTPVVPSAESTLSTPQASPSSAQSDGGETIARKMGDGLLSPSPGTQRRRMEPLRLLQGMTTEESPLIQPSEVVVSQRPVLTAEPVLTPIEKLRRKDEVIRLALAEKQQLVADILHVPREEFETIADLAGEPSVHKESSELVLAAVNQVNQLTTVVNDALRVSEEEAVSAASEGVTRRVERLPSIPAHQLQGIASALNSHLTQLLKTVKSQDEERDCLRRELQRLREQVHAMHESRRRSQMEAPPSPRPARVPGSEDDSVLLAGLQRLALKDDAPCDEAKDTSPDLHDDASADVFVDALSGEAESHLEAQVEEDGRPDAIESLERTVSD